MDMPVGYIPIMMVRGEVGKHISFANHLQTNRTGQITPRVSVPDLSRYSSAPSVHQGLVSRQRGGATSVSLCDLVSLGTDEFDTPGG